MPREGPAAFLAYHHRPTASKSVQRLYHLYLTPKLANVAEIDHPENGGKVTMAETRVNHLGLRFPEFLTRIDSD
jgi:hypothetical protein